MPELTVRLLGQDDWAAYRTVRLLALQDSPDVFGETHDQEATASEAYWWSQMTSAQRIAAELDGHLCGVVSVGRFSEEPESADLFGLWVDPSARSSGVAWRLVETAAAIAVTEGIKQMYYWVGTDNGRAIGFATGFGFRLTSHRRNAAGRDAAQGETEIALVLPLEQDPFTVPNATAGSMLHR